MQFVIQTRRGRCQSELNAFTLGREHERYRIKDLASRIERCETLVRQLHADDQPQGVSTSSADPRHAERTPSAELVRRAWAPLKLGSPDPPLRPARLRLGDQGFTRITALGAFGCSGRWLGAPQGRSGP